MLLRFILAALIYLGSLPNAAYVPDARPAFTKPQ